MAEWLRKTVVWLILVVLCWFVLPGVTRAAGTAPIMQITLPRPGGATSAALSDVAIDLTPDLIDVPGYSVDAKWRFAAPAGSAATVKVVLPSWTESAQIGSNYASAWNAQTGQLTLRPAQRVWVTAHRQEALPDQPIQRWQISFADLAAWRGPFRSARVTLRFPQTVTNDLFLTIRPGGYQFTGRALNWLYEGQRPPDQFIVVLVRPSFWLRLQEERKAAATGDVEALNRLGKDAATLALSPDLPGVYFDRYFQEALAAFLQVTKRQPKNSAAWLWLARLYQAEGQHFSSQWQSDLALSAEALRKGWLAGQQDSQTQDQLLATYKKLIRQSQGNGDFSGALLLLDQLTGLAQEHPLANAPDLRQWQQEIVVAWLKQRLQAGDFVTAQQIIRRYWGKSWQRRLTMRAPRFQSMYIRVYTKLFQSRTIQVEIVPYPAMDNQWIQAWQQDVASLRSQAPEDVRSNIEDGIAYLTITLPAKDATTLRRAEQSLGGALSQDTAWLPLRSVLLEDTVQWGKERSFWRWRWYYQERVPLANAFQAMNTATASVLDSAPFPADAALSEEARQLLQEAYGKEAAAAWRTLMQNVQLDYTLEAPSFWPAHDRSYHWRAALGDELAFATQGVVYEPRRLLLIAVIGLLAWFFLWLGLRRLGCTKD